jgi:beta-lactam-binding protein with PASTA domain
MTPAATAAAAAMSAGGQPTQIRRRSDGNDDQATDPYYSEPARKASVWPWILVIILILALAGAAYAIFSNWGNASAQLMPVPNVVGLSEADAQQQIEAAGFKYKREGEQASATVAQGKIVRQQPDEGNNLAKGTEVSVWVSSGKGMVSVPSVVGKTVSEASNQLGLIGLEVKQETEATEDQTQVGKVLRQSPGEGKSVDAGTTVTIVVGVASNTVAVPRVIGLTQDQATATLSGLNLVADPQEQQSTEPGGTVVDQNPKEGTNVQPGSTVTIYVSNAPASTKVKVPAVAGPDLNYSVGEATAKLALYQLKAQITYYETNDYDPGIVLQQDPVAGTEVDKGSTVELWVSKTPETTTTTEPPSTTSTTVPPSTDTTFTTGF